MGSTDASTNEVTEIGCTVVDDGSFTFNAEIRDEIGAGFIADWSSYLRIAYNVVQSGEAILFIQLLIFSARYNASSYLWRLQDSKVPVCPF